MRQKLRIAIIGAGMGGLAVAAALRHFGFQARVFEQARGFARVGAGIQMSPNAMKALRGLGLESVVRERAFRPVTWDNRDGDTGASRFELPLGDAAEARYGAPYLQLHRADLHAALLSAVPAADIEMGRDLVGIEAAGDGYRLHFAHGAGADADLVIGADGLHSRVREILHGPARPRATGRVAYRATFPADRLRHGIGACTKWWGEDRHIVIYYVTRTRDEVYFVTSLPDAAWVDESWSAEGDMAVVRAAFAGFHAEVREVLHACPAVHRWAILDREPLTTWHEGGLVLLGDAAHPMTPYMAQGAAMALEDAVVLARTLDAESDPAVALATFERLRQARTAEAQAVSHANTWMREATDPTWCYGYDPWTVTLGS